MNKKLDNIIKQIFLFTLVKKNILMCSKHE